MHIFPRGMNDQELAKVIKDGAIAVVKNKISLYMFNSGMKELSRMYGESRIDNIKNQLIREMEGKDLDFVVYDEFSEEGYIQQDFARQKQEMYTKLRKLVNKDLLQKMNIDYQKIIDSQIKNIDATPQIIQYNPRDDVRENDLNLGQETMRGIEYVQQARGDRAYKHMRAMLQTIWNIQYKHPDSRFDIDGRFAYNSEQLANYINNSASVAEIDQAHELVKQSYRAGQRGRPKGARNKAKVISKDFTELDTLLEDLQTDDVKQEIDHEPEIVIAKVGENIDLSKFVTHPQLDRKAAELRGDMHKVAENITDSLKSAFEALEDKVNNIKLNQPTLVEIKVAELPKVELGVQHRTFSTLLKICGASLRNGNRIIPWVYGPAGTGKSTAAENVAKALSLPYYSLGKTLAKFEILGFINTSGYQSTEFRNAYENGGVFCADEMDAWSAEAIVALNGALANGHCAFPDKSVKRHKDFVMITCANTTGAGATMDYVGRNKQDGATLDRFVNLFWPLDEALEDSMVANKDWLKYVRHVRARVAASGINPKPIVSPRASLHGESLLFNGLDWNLVVDLTLRKGLSDAQWNMIK